LRSEQAELDEAVSAVRALAELLLEANQVQVDVLRKVEVKTAGHDQSLARVEQVISSLLTLLDERAREKDSTEEARIRDAEAAVHKEMIRVRDEGITWLRDEVANYQQVSEALAAANRILNEELSEKHSQINILKAAVHAAELELLGLTISRGWRLLQQFRRVRRWFRKITGRPNPMPSTRSTLITESREDEWHARLNPLLEEIKARVAGLAGVQATEQTEALVEPARPQHSRIRLQPTPSEHEFRAALDEMRIPESLGRPAVVCFSVIDWQFRYQRPQQMMSQFAAHGHRVFYISTTRFTPPGRTPRVAVKTIKENVFEVELCSVHQPDVYGESIGGINWAELEASLDELRTRFSIDEAISYVMISSWAELAQMTKARWGWRLIYDCMDEWDRFPGIRPAIVEAEKQLVEACDLLIVSSRCLAEKWSAHRDKLRLARNAVDYDFYVSRYGPNHLLADAKRPIVGYFGAIADWFDLDLLRFIADKRPDYTFVLLGGVFGVDIADLLNRPNVKFLGQQPYELMPKYLYQFDVCMIPFKINAITEATDPVKVYEYLSGGKPVVSVNLPELAPYREHLYIANSPEEFVTSLDEALNDKDRDRSEARRQLARSNDWRDRYQTIMDGLRSQTPRASVIIVTYNNLEMTRLCLESVLINTEYPNYEIIVVDNKSEDGTPAYLKFMEERFPQIRVVLNDVNAGFARANNQAIVLSTSEYIVLLNNDTVVPPGWLSRLTRHLRHREVGLVGPVSNFVGNEARIDANYATWEDMVSFARQHTSSRDGEATDIHMLAMFCVALRRDVCNEVGLLDEQFGVGMFEDDDYAHRVRLKGYRVICAADAFVHHFGQASFKKLITTGEYDVIFQRNLTTYEKKWNVKWTARSNVALDFRIDYIDNPHQNGRVSRGD
jgi:GT2 family glycosyltransferase/glycosyltransferase involved in cell wall biosynthesis